MKRKVKDLGKGRTILVIEDDPALNRIVRKQLRKEGLDSEGIITGKDALERIGKGGEFLLLLDHVLSDMTAFDLLKELHSTGGVPPFLIMTGRGDERLSVEMMKLGARDYLVKDVNFIELIPQAVVRVLETLEMETRLKKVRAALTSSEDRYKRTFDEAGLGMTHQGLDGRFLKVNRRLCEMLDRTEEELLSMSSLDITVAGDVPETMRQMEQLLQGEKHTSSLEKRYIRKDGTLLWVNVTMTLSHTPGGEPSHFISIVKDQTLQKEARSALLTSERNLKAAQKVAKLGYWELDLLTEELNWSEDIYRIFEMDPERFRPSYDTFIGMIHPDDRDAFDDAYSVSLKNSTPYNIIHRLLLSDGSIKYVNERCEPIFDEDGYPIKFIGTLHDISEIRKAEEAFRKSEETLRTFMESATDGIAILDKDLNYLEMNPSGVHIFGLKRGSIVGKNAAALDPELKRSGRSRAFEKVIATGRPHYTESVIRNPKRGPLDIETRAFKVDEGLGIIFRDITERVEAQKREMFVKHILKRLNQRNDVKNILHDILVEIREFMGIEAVAIRLREGEDFPYYEQIGFPDDFIEHERNLEPPGCRGEGCNGELECFCGAVISGILDHDLKYFTQGGSFLSNDAIQLTRGLSENELPHHFRGYCMKKGYRSMALIPLHSGDETIGLLQLNDRRKNMFSGEMIQFLEGTATTIGIGVNKQVTMEKMTELAHRLEGMNRELISASKLKDEFLANTSHELRTPLNAILGLLKLIIDGLYDSEEERTEFIGIAYKSSKQLLDVINDLLELSRIGSGKMEINIVEDRIEEFISYSEDLFRKSIEGKGLAFHVDRPPDGGPVVLFDPHMLRQILNNLLSNAMKFTPTGSVTLEAVPLEKEGTMRISVTDTGIGIDPENIGNIYEPFYQVDGSSTRKFGGTGLGLAITKNMLDLMGGRIWVESKGKGKGTRISFTLPLAGGSRGIGKKGSDL